MRSFLHFLQYHNAVPVAVAVVLLGAGGAYAAQNPEAIYEAEHAVNSVDNTYIIGADIATWDFRLLVTDVREDADSYYVDYSYRTISLADYIWQELPMTGSFTVAKKALVGRDLGLYVAKQMAEIAAAQRSYLLAVQAQEREAGESVKVVSTTYSGLIGRLLDPSQETFANYTPVVDEAAIAAAAAAAAVTASDAGSTTSAAVQTSGAPTIQVLGKNPAYVPVGAQYSDLGAWITGPTETDRGLGIKIIYEGKQVSYVEIDTAAPATYTIRYTATNGDHKTGEAVRTVIVYDPNDAAAAAKAMEPAPEIADSILPPAEVPAAPDTSDDSELGDDAQTPAETTDEVDATEQPDDTTGDSATGEDTADTDDENTQTTEEGAGAIVVPADGDEQTSGPGSL